MGSRRSKKMKYTASPEPSQFVDNMADESDGQSDIPPEEGSEGLRDFIVDDDAPLSEGGDRMPDSDQEMQDVDAEGHLPLDEDAVAVATHNSEGQGQDDLPVDLIAARPSKQRKKRRLRANVNDSDSQDLTRLDRDDSMFSRSSGVKPSLLPTPLKTRSTTASSKPLSGSTDDSSEIEIVPTSPKKRRIQTSDSDFPETVTLPGAKAPQSIKVELGVLSTPSTPARPPPTTPRKNTAPSSRPPSTYVAINYAGLPLQSVAVLQSNWQKPKVCRSLSTSNVKNVASPATPKKKASPVKNTRVQPAGSPVHASSRAGPSTFSTSLITPSIPSADSAGPGSASLYLATYMQAQGPILAKTVLDHVMPVLASTIQNAMAPNPTSAVAQAPSPSPLTIAPSSSRQPPVGTTPIPSPSAAPSSALLESAIQRSPTGPLKSAEAVPHSTRVPVFGIGSPFTSLSKDAGIDPSAATALANVARVGDNSASALPAENSSVIQPASLGAPSQSDVPAATVPSATAPPPPSRMSFLADMFTADAVVDTVVDFNASAVPAPDPTFLEDLESYKTKYDSSVPCQVYDESIQDPILIPIYKDLPPLPKRDMLPSYTREDLEQYEEELGRVSFSGWQKAIKFITPFTIESAMIFTQFEEFINPSRVSPTVITVKPTKTGGLSLRLHVGTKVAICVSVGMCTESCLVDAVQTRSTPPMYHKYLALMYHNYDWQRWAAFVCLCFKEPFMFAPMQELALQIGTVLSHAEGSSNAAPLRKSNIHRGMLSPVKSTKHAAMASPAKQTNDYNLKYALRYNDTIPVYDATNKNFDFERQLPMLDSSLPRWAGEIPVGSFVVTGCTLSTYKGKAKGYGDVKQEHVGSNLLWAIVCGVPRDYRT
ncbi:hypothetical protein B0H17DRAFT_1224009 [Mycena rosella]|uniref:Uncharacterized protein n=1 Tax=Mycena rosella TaxID=1033263 RepID=A0AAD7H3W7_MYCRO|nr:hypothetical protein B0H17DRAFT_1224009 [Mycena rosella]